MAIWWRRGGVEKWFPMVLPQWRGETTPSHASTDPARNRPRPDGKGATRGVSVTTHVAKYIRSGPDASSGEGAAGRHQSRRRAHTSNAET